MPTKGYHTDRRMSGSVNFNWQSATPVYAPARNNLWQQELTKLATATRCRMVELLLALAEVWRRHQWSFIRVESELRKVAARCDERKKNYR